MDIDKIKKGLKIFLIVILIIVFINIMNKDFFNQSDGEVKVDRAFDTGSKDSLSEADAEEGYIYTHITGEIKKPGVYKMKAGTRMDDLVKAAGGLTEDADIDLINLSEKLADEERIIVPAKGTSEADETSQAANSVQTKKININTADLYELTSIPSVGEKTAQKIIDYREKKKFKKIEDIMNIEGIGENKFKNMKDYISVSGR